MDINNLHAIFLNSNGICTDTRKLVKGQLFFALKGDNFDGNKYAKKAIESGASKAIVDDSSVKNEDCILVPNVLECLQELARHHRKHLDIPIIALTGSNGKTTTKELIDAVIKTQYNTTATLGNLNNHIGVPLTLLNMDNNTEIGIVEMGANHLKEIAFLSSIALPNYGYITNIGKAHLEGFGSEENILIGKTELYKYIEETKGLIFSNIDDKKLLSQTDNLQKVTFSNNKKADYRIELISADPCVKVSYANTIINSNLIGLYNYTNIAASVTIGLHMNVSIANIKKGIEKYIPQINRSEIIKKETNHIILDAYNANPSSMKAALDNFEKTKTNKSKIVILGDMFELGKYSKKEHQEIVNFIEGSSSMKKAYLAGEHFSKTIFTKSSISIYNSTKSLLKELDNQSAIEDSYILIKGSRGMALEQVLNHL